MAINYGKGKNTSNYNLGFNLEKALVGAVSVIVKTNGSFGAL